MTDFVENSVDNLISWVEGHNYRAYDPGDGSLSFLLPLTLNVPFFRRLLTAVVLRTPIHIRPWIGIRPHTSTKGMGYFAWGYTKMFALTGDESYRRRAEMCFEWLIANRSNNSNYCWGNHFAFSTRAGTIEKHTPTIVWSSLIGLAFLEAYETLGVTKYLEVAASTVAWIKTLPRERTNSGLCLSYVPGVQSSIHNSNMLGASLLAKVAALTKDREGMDLATEAMTYSCSRQLQDGAWFYGEAEKYQWIDNFHTGYNLDCLKRYIDSSGDRSCVPNLTIGFRYFMEHFFEQDGRPKYYHNQTYPIDIQCAAQSIDTLSFFSDVAPASLALAGKVTQWTIQNMQDEDGHFYYRDLGWKMVKTPMFHWGQGTMFKALSHLMTKATNHNSLAIRRSEIDLSLRK
jgi:hypothetical protein